MPREPSTLRGGREAERPAEFTQVFDPERHRAELLAIIDEIAGVSGAAAPIPTIELDRVLRRHPREGRGFFSRSELIAGFRHFARSVDFSLDEAGFLERVQLRPVRTQSGVTPLTVLTKPFPCPGGCIFCPNDVRMPKSYLADEPGAQRAAANHFDPYLQTWNRLATYRAIGHPVEKIELIVLGGTWSFLPEPYQIWFSKCCFDALNDFGRGVDGRERIRVRGFAALRAESKDLYNDAVSVFLRSELDGDLIGQDEQASWRALRAAQRENEDAACRSVGFVVETRPDHLSKQEIVRIRRLGCTKVQIGYQSLCDEVLRMNRRGHDVAAIRRATALLRSAGFKIHAHWMPNLLGSSPERDRADFARLFDDPDFRPDELKIYPCSLIESAELMRFYERGEWRPYEHAELLEVVAAALASVPRYCRVTRVVRDISSHDIVAGNKLTNFRQIAERVLEQRGARCVDIRAREIRADEFDPELLRLVADDYATAIGRESFLEFVTKGDRIVAFLRLSLPERASFIPEIADSALIREVHVYGSSLAIGAKPGAKAQHRGLGQRLIEEAVRRAEQAGFRDLAVISAVGTRPYYRRLGFNDGELYQHLRVRAAPSKPAGSDSPSRGPGRGRSSTGG